MEPIKNFTDLRVWQLAHELRKDVYKLIEKLPPSERYNLKSQIQRAVTSIAALVAEGFGRFHYQENIQFCRQARGSLEEVCDGMIFANEMQMLGKEECQRVF